MNRTPAWFYPVCLLIFVCASSAAQEEPAAYQLGAGDHIIIQVHDEPDLSMDFHLNHSGILNYPFLGELKVAGLSVLELEKLITNGLRGRYLIDPDVTVSIEEYRSFFINGEVENPGGFPYQPSLTQERLIRQAHFRLHASVAQIDYQHPRNIKQSQIAQLAAGDWINRTQNLLVTGPCGSGKTYLACALGHNACLRGYSVRYYRLSRLLLELTQAQADGSYYKKLKQLVRMG